MGVKFLAHTEGETWAAGFDNRVLRRIFGPKRDEVTRGVEKTT
jgi:hypothetical protein